MRDRDDLRVKEELLKKIDAKIEELKVLSTESGLDMTQQIRQLEERRDAIMREIFSSLTPWDEVQLARHPERPTTLDYINLIFSDFIELRGDRYTGDDPALIGGIGFLDEQPVMIIGHQKGKDTKDRLRRNFGMPQPAGFKKAIRLMRLAERWGLPVISFVDTPGAYPGITAEERGQFLAIAESIAVMARLKTLTIANFIGEGGSGGALAIGIGNYVIMLQHAYFSVISPEGCASIIYRDSKRAPQAAEKLKLTSADLLALGVVDRVLPEPIGGAHRDPRATADTLREAIKAYLREGNKYKPEELVKMRFEKYDRLVTFIENSQLKTSIDLSRFRITISEEREEDKEES